MARTDPEAVWGWQGWALNVMGRGATLPEIESYLRGFHAGAPAGNFFVIDMGVHATPGQWQQFHFGDIPFIWTALEDFGGTLSLKGNLGALDTTLPWAALAANATGFWGVGASPEGLDQNPVVYEILAGASLLQSPVTDRTSALLTRAHRRYGLVEVDANVSRAWESLSASSYSVDLGVSDETGVGLLSPSPDPIFWNDRTSQPTPLTCKLWDAWGALLDAGLAAPSSGLDVRGEPFIYDLTDVGREVLSRLSTPLALAFQSELHAGSIDTAALRASALAYSGLLRAMDALLGADGAFLLGPWLDSAREWGTGGFYDCKESIRGENISCADFYEWNARSQLTTWYPPLSPSGEGGLIPRDGDYARKQWSGLCSGFYATRVDALLAVGLNYNGSSAPSAAINQALATHAWDWVTSTAPYPSTPMGDPIELGLTTRQRYAEKFASCTAAQIIPS